MRILLAALSQIFELLLQGKNFRENSIQFSRQKKKSALSLRTYIYTHTYALHAHTRKRNARETRRGKSFHVYIYKGYLSWWQRRRKSEHYECLQEYVNEISDILQIDPWHLMADWFVSENKCLEKEACRISLASEVDDFLRRIAKRYEELGIKREPVAFIKNDRGTYGLGIMAVKSGTELLNLSRRKFKNYRTPSTWLRSKSTPTTRHYRRFLA